MAKKIRQWESSRREISKTLSKYMKEHVRNNGGSVTTLKKENSRIAQGANFKGNASPRGTLQNSIRGGSSPRCYPLSFCIPFKITKWKISLPFSIMWNLYLFIYLKPEKGVLSGGASPHTFIGNPPTHPSNPGTQGKRTYEGSIKNTWGNGGPNGKNPGKCEQAARRTRWSVRGTSRGEHMTKRLVTHEDWETGKHYGNRNIYHETKMDERNVKWIRIPVS